MSDIAVEQTAPDRAPFKPGAWHDPGDLAAAIHAVKTSAAHHERVHVAEFLLPRLPSWTLVSNTLKTDRPSSHRAPMARAWRAKWLSVNTRTRVNSITIDVDHEEWATEMRALSGQGIPHPTWVTWNPVSDHAQITWVLPIGASRENHAQMRLVDGLRTRLTTDLGGDTNFKNWLIRNPVHPENKLLWFSGKAVELSAFMPALLHWSDEKQYILGPRLAAQFNGRAPAIPAIPKTIIDAIGEKGSRVWEAGRHAVYRSRSSDLANIRAILQTTADSLRSPISARALDGMAKRISQWMSKQDWANGVAARGHRPGIDHGVMTREADARGMKKEWIRTPRAVKLPLAAERTNGIRRGKTAEAIAGALEELAQGTEEISQASLATAAGLSRRTVAKLWSQDVSAACQLCELRSYPFSEGRSPADQQQNGPCGGLITKSSKDGGDIHISNLDDVDEMDIRPHDGINGRSRETRDIRTHGDINGRSREAPPSPRGEGVSQKGGRVDGGAGRDIQKHQEMVTLFDIVASINRRIRESNEQKKRDDAAIAKYDGQTARMMKSGARMEPVSEPARGAAEAVLAAYQRARAAQRSAGRRQHARDERTRNKANAQERREKFRKWADDGNHDAFSVFLKMQNKRWDEMGDVVERRGGDMDKHNMMRGVYTARIRKEWKDAMKYRTDSKDKEKAPDNK